MAIPNGGAKDTQAPQIDYEKSFPKNASVNFNSQSIFIQFDEFIRLSNAQQQIIISPALEKNPTYVVKGKTLRITFNEELKANTTYNINFGNSISDITEGNSTKNLAYVFSTGTFLDSCFVTGTILNSKTGLPAKSCKVMLTASTSDSAIYKERPLYFALSDESGNFKISHIKQGKYLLYAIQDANSNYLFSSDEEMAFSSDLIEFNDSSQQVNINLKLFKEVPKDIQLSKRKFVAPARADYFFNRPATQGEKQLLEQSLSEKCSYQWQGNDTLQVWYSINYADEIVLSNREMINDTSRFSFQEREIENYLSSALPIKNTVPSFMELYGKLALKFSDPIVEWNPNAIHLFRDSVEVNCKWEKEGLLQLNADYSFMKEAKTNYFLLIEPGAIKNYYGLTNVGDTIRFSTQKAEYYGALLLKIRQPHAKAIVQLLNDKSQIVAEQKVDRFSEIKFTLLKPGNYSLRLLIDENENGKWDTGNFLKRQQPERFLFYSDKITIRSNWDVDLEWKIN